MKPLLIFLAALIAACPARATIQADMLCWDPSLEFPVPCDDGDG